MEKHTQELITGKKYFPSVNSLFKTYKDYYAQNYFENELQNTNIKLKDFILKQKVKMPDNTDLYWLEFFKGDASGENIIQKIFSRGCENVNSGIDKGSPQDANQLENLWISSAFGSLKRKVNDENDFDSSRLCFFRDFHRFLEDKYYYRSPDWKEIRNWVFEHVKPWYSRLLSDSRFPVNDVTLFDQVYMTASMFKAVLASLYIDNSNYQNFIKNPQLIKWSVLGIQYDKLALAEKGLKVASIKWYRETVNKVDNQLKKLIEIEYPLGNEVYRDETGIYFVVGENIKGDKDSEFYKLNNALSVIKTKIQDIFTSNFEGEIYPAILLTEPSRGLMNLGHLVEKAKENFLKAEYPSDFKTKLKHDSNPNGICQICNMRLAHKGNKNNLICDTCQERLKGRVSNWINNLDKETIWIDEIQDKNGRVALVTLKFELEKWLNGDMVNSLIIQNIDFPIENNCKNTNSLLLNIADGIKQNKKLNNTCLKNYHTNIPNLGLKDIVKKWFLERSIGSRWEEFIKNNLSDKTAIDFKNRKIDWRKLNNQDIEFLAYLILQFILRKNPSPARLRRIWETTNEFLNNLESKIIELAEIKEERCKRLYWENISIDDGEYEDGNLLFWAENSAVYLISSIEKIEKEEFKLRKCGEKNSRIVITLKREQAKKESYKPYFTILSPTPVSWQFIIPAENIPAVIKNIQKEYYKNFRWVYGKLPLHIGVIIQNYKKPLYIGIKALRKIRRDNVKWEDLKVELNWKELKARQKTAFRYQEKPEITSQCEDFYSIYEKTSGTGKYEFYLYPEKNKIKIWIDTTQNSSDTDKFKIYPNTFDFEFLDSNTRRNDIFYKSGKRFLEFKSNRPYDLYHWDYFFNFREFFFSDEKSSSKLQKLVSLIYSKLEDWKKEEESIKAFMLSAFVNILELRDEKSKNEFARLLGFTKFEDLQNLKENEFRKKLYLILDLFDFWHTSLKY
ncbi:CRISPR-associated protein Csx11 [Desulfurobacterium sp.]